MPFYFFHWTDYRIEHLAINDVSQEEFEYVVCHPQFLGTSHSSGNPLAAGHTPEGRYLICIYKQLDPDTLMPITAFEPE